MKQESSETREAYEAPALERQSDWDVITGSPASSRWTVK